MYKKSSIDPVQVLVFAFISLFSNWVSYLIAMYAAIFLKKIDILPSQIRLTILLYVVLIPISLIISLGIIYIFFKDRVPSHFKPNEDKSFMLKNLILLIAPGELVRFIVCFSSLGDMTKTGTFALPASVLFEGIYQTATSRLTLITQDKFIFADYVAYIICYAVYFAIYFACLYFLYKRLWNIRKRERDELITHK